MMPKLIFKQSLASLPSLEALYDLARSCEKADGFYSKIYWHTLLARKNDTEALDYLCYIENELVGMLNILFFTESIEITALVKPEYRKKGIFRTMLRVAMSKLRQYDSTHFTLICNAKSETLVQRCLQRGAIEDHTEIEMLAPNKIKISDKQKLILQQATLNETPILAMIHEACFKEPSAKMMEKRFEVSLLDSYRRVYLAKNNNGDFIGKIHVREDFNRICLHDVGILPAYQRQGFGYRLMASWIDQHAKEHQKPIIVEVLGDNNAALKLYQKCEFQAINHYHCYRFSFPSGNVF